MKRFSSIRSGHADLAEFVKHASPAQMKRFLNAYRDLSERDFGPRIRRSSNPVIEGKADVITQPIYDSFSIAAATAVTKQTLFQTPIGQSSKTLANTNMSQAGILPNPQKLTVYAIRLYFSNLTTPTDLVNFLLNCSFDWKIGTKSYLTCPCLFLTAGFGGIATSIAEIGTVAAGDVAAFTTSNGHADQRSIFELSRPITIEQGESFQVVINPETGFSTQAATTRPAGTGTTVYVVLDGELERGVQ
jgi:hypothetical protein